MNIVTHLQELEKLIVDNTQGPVTAKLRNQLSLALEQAEAHSDAVAKQERTLAQQIKTIEQISAESRELQQRLAKMETEQRKVGVTLTNGSRVFYDAGTHAIVPSKLNPQIVDSKE